jgi:predicted NodU family carbamoyl transferase
MQTVHGETNPFYYDLIERFNALTGCPVPVNTSFNVRSGPIVCTPEEAFRCFMTPRLISREPVGGVSALGNATHAV